VSWQPLVYSFFHVVVLIKKKNFFLWPKTTFGGADAVVEQRRLMLEIFTHADDNLRTRQII
jgi:hypothetical protein